jgi:copper transport protein
MTKNQTRVLLVLAIVSFSAVFLILPNIPNSYAHALIVKSDPAPSQSLPTSPSKVDVYFTDPVDIRYSVIKVLDPNGKEIQNKDEHYITIDQTSLSVSLPVGLPNGVYTVSTKVLDQTDGHVTENGFVFAVGVAAPQNAAQPKISYSNVISTQDAVARFPALIGQVIVVGAAFSTLWLWRPVSKITGLKERFAETRLKIDKRATKLILVGSIITFASGFGMIAAEAFSINAGFVDAVSTKFGQSWIVRMVIASILLGLSLMLYLKHRKSNSVLHKWQTAVILGVGIATLSTTSIISHGAATGKAVPLILDFIHNLVASIWIGGILYFDFIIIPKLKQISDKKIPSAILSIVIPKFGTVVLLILGTITITGPFLLFFLENNLDLTLASIYGKILIVKLSLACVMIAIGAYHQLFIHKQSFKALAVSGGKNFVAQESDHVKILSKFGFSARAEAIVGIALIASVAVLVDSGLPATEFQDLLQSQQSGLNVLAATPSSIQQNVFTDTGFVNNGSRVILSINPYFIGSNDITISFLDTNRNPVDIQSVLLELAQTDKSIGPIKVDTQQISTGIYSAQTDSLTIPGNWHAHVEGVPTAAGSLSMVADYDLNVKPKVSQISANIQEYKLPDNQSLPLYPIYDKDRNVIWVGDTKIKSGKIIEFNLDSKKYTEHSIDGTNIITYAALDTQGNLWYVDPITRILCHFNPSDNSNQIYHVPISAILSGLAIDNSGNVWLTASNTSELVKFNPNANNFTSIELAAGSVPLGIAIDKSSGQIWIAESGTGKLTNIDPSNNYKITEYGPTQENNTLASPTALLVDPLTGKVFVSEHDGAAVSVFDPLLKTFTRYQLDSQGLPFGMAFDSNHDLWIAQHTLNKIAVLDARTGETNEFDIPSPSSFTQWITSDSQGNIIMAEQRANAIGIVTTTVTPTLSQSSIQTSGAPAILKLGFSYAEIAAPSIAISLVAVAFVFSKNAVDLKNNIKHIRNTYT